jgi:hypothetical protein
MLKHLFPFILGFCLVTDCADAQIYRVKHFSGAARSASPVVVPGVSPPTVNTTTRQMSYGVNDITPTSHGSPGDNGYGLRGSIRWDATPFVEYSGVVQLGLFAYHPPTDAEKAAGLANNVGSVRVRCDKGAWVTIPQTSVNASAGGVIDWNVTLNINGAWSDGLHTCDAVAIPYTGPDIIAEGPPQDAYVHLHDQAKALNAAIDNGSGAAGSTLSIYDTTLFTWQNGTTSETILSIGHSVSMVGVAPNTFIDGTSTVNPTACVADTGSNCTGAGLAGTYHVNVGSQTVHGADFTATISGTVMTVTAVSGSGNVQPGYNLFGSGVTGGTKITCSTTCTGTHCGSVCTGAGYTGTYELSTSSTVGSPTSMQTAEGASFGNLSSYTFITNFSGTLARKKYYVSLSGSNANDGLTSATPVADIGRAQQLASLLANGGLYGSVVCLMNGSTYSYAGSTAIPWSSQGWTQIVGADQPPCSVGGDPGNPTLNVISTDRTYFPLHTMWKYLNLKGNPSTQNSATGWYLAVDHVTQKKELTGLGGLLQNGAYTCVESTSWFGTDGGCSGAVLSRNVTGKYIIADCAHQIPVLVNETCEYAGPNLYWATGTSTSGSNVITGISFVPSELSSYVASDIWLATANPSIAPFTTAAGVFQAGTAATSCFPGTYTGVTNLTQLYVGAVTSNSITVVDWTGNPVNAVSTCVNGTLASLGAHSDALQEQIGIPIHDIYLVGNSFLKNSTGNQQGLFLEYIGIGNSYIAQNWFNSAALDAESMVLINGGNENIILTQNIFQQNKSVRLDTDGSHVTNSKNATMIGDQCMAGVPTPPSFNGSGTNVRRLANISSQCYTTTTP